MTNDFAGSTVKLRCAARPNKHINRVGDMLIFFIVVLFSIVVVLFSILTFYTHANKLFTRTRRGDSTF